MKMNKRMKWEWVQAGLVMAVVGAVALAALPVRGEDDELAERRKNHCINHLRQIEAAKEQWALANKQPQGAEPAFDDIKDYIKNPEKVMRCPAGGTIKINAIGENCTCTIEGHELMN